MTTQSKIETKTKYFKDIYQQFIESCLKKTYLPNIKLYKHRILPGFENGTYASSNILWCSYKDHCLAHFYRWLSYKKKEDLLAWKLMTNQTEDKFRLAGQIGGKAVQKIQHQNKTHFYDSTAKIQKLGNLKRWGIKINNVRFPYSELNSTFIEFYKTYLLNRKKRIFTTTEYEQICLLNIEEINGFKAQKLNKQLVLKDQKKLSKQYIVRLGAFCRHGIKVDNQRVPFQNLNPIFIAYHKHYHLIEGKLTYTKKQYNEICQLKLDKLDNFSDLNIAKQISNDFLNQKKTKFKKLKKVNTKTSILAKKRAFHRYGIKIENQRIAFKNLSPVFIDFHEIFFLTLNPNYKKNNYTKYEYNEICNLNFAQIDSLKAQHLYKEIKRRYKPFHPRRGAFHKNGIKIDNCQIPFQKLHPCFIEYHDTYHIMKNAKTSYTQTQYNQICKLTFNEIHGLKGKKMFKKMCQEF